MNEVSIIINGVRYDAVEGVEICSCKGCEIEDECENVIGLCTNNTVFKKSTKSFER